MYSTTTDRKIASLTPFLVFKPHFLGYNKVWKKLTFTAVTTTKIRVLANASVDGWSRVTELEAWGTAAPPPRTNVALAASGGTATASSYYSDSTWGSYIPSLANNGDRQGAVAPAQPGGWNDAAPGDTFPDWLQIDFNGSKTIDEIDVITEQDNYSSPIEPTETTTFSVKGLTGYDVQYWNGSAWVTVTGGSISGNNKVWKKLTFSAITTTKIRVLTNASGDGYCRVQELEAWTAASGGSTSSNINWLVTDQLGTPRMIFDQGGSLATTKRHDYAPFGEELFNGLRPNVVGYGADSTRQKFTSKERDNETGLDYFKARYYSSAQGRFASADSFGGSKLNPQSLNRYAYVKNNPLAFTDPTGHMAYPWMINPLDYLRGRRVSEPMMGQDPSKPNLPVPVAPAGVPDIPQGTVGIPTVTEFQPIPPHKSFWQRVKGFFGFGSAAGAGTSMWGRPETLTRHFRDHGADFESSSEAEYAQQAQDLLLRASQGGAKMKIGPDGVIRVYEAETNTFAAYNMNGTTRTMFKPNAEEFYFVRQPGRSPWFPRGAEPEVEPELEPEIPIEIPPLP